MKLEDLLNVEVEGKVGANADTQISDLTIHVRSHLLIWYTTLPLLLEQITTNLMA